MQDRSFLAPGGESHCNTDDAPLFEATKRYLALCGFEIAYITDDLHASGYAPNYVSEHEALYAGRGLPIHFLIARMVELPKDFSYEIDGHRIDRVERGTTGRAGRAREQEEGT